MFLVMLALHTHGSTHDTRIPIDGYDIRQLTTEKNGVGVVTLEDGTRWPISNVQEVLDAMGLGLDIKES